MEGTTIKVSDWTWKELNKYKSRGESFDDVIKKALGEYYKIKKGDNKDEI